MQNSEESLSARGAYSSFLSASLKGISQVIFIENVVSGLIILLAITVSSYKLGIIALLSAFIGTFIGKMGGSNAESVNQGLFGYNSVLTGLALTLFLSGPYHWIIALIGAAITAILTASIMHAMRNTEMPILTFPFIVLTWFMLLVSYRLKGVHLSPTLVPQDLARWELNIEGELNWREGAFNGIGQIFFLDNTFSGILLFIAVFWAGWKWGVYAIIGNIVALVAAYVLGGEHRLIIEGLYGYNAILAILAVAIVFNMGHHRYAPLSGIIAACLTVPTCSKYKYLAFTIWTSHTDNAFCSQYMDFPRREESITSSLSKSEVLRWDITAS